MGGGQSIQGNVLPREAHHCHTSIHALLTGCRGQGEEESSRGTVLAGQQRPGKGGELCTSTACIWWCMKQSNEPLYENLSMNSLFLNSISMKLKPLYGQMMDAHNFQFISCSSVYSSHLYNHTKSKSFVTVSAQKMESDYNYIYVR